MPSGTQVERVGAPMADSSLMVCEPELYASHCIGMKTIMATYSSDEAMPHVSRSLRHRVLPAKRRSVQ